MSADALLAMPAWVLQERGLTPHMFSVLASIINLTRQSRACDASNSEIGRPFSMSGRTVARDLLNLERGGAIRRIWYGSHQGGAPREILVAITKGCFVMPNRECYWWDLDGDRHIHLHRDAVVTDRERRHDGAAVTPCYYGTVVQP